LLRPETARVVVEAVAEIAGFQASLGAGQRELVELAQLNPVLWVALGGFGWLCVLIRLRRRRLGRQQPAGSALAVVISAGGEISP
jgi:hypothetical protein